MCNEQETQTLTDSFEAFDRQILYIRRAWEFWSLIDGSAIGGPDANTLFDAAPRFHWYTRHSLLATIVLGLSRLADQMKDHKGRENLTLERVYKETEDSYQIAPNLKAKQAMNNALKEIGSNDFQKVRNKILAHNDLATVIANEDLLNTEVIRHAVVWVARFHSRIKAVRDGTGINHRTGEGALPSPADVQVCWQEITRLFARLT